MKKKGLALVLALTLVVVGIVSGTLAWLTDKSDTVVNTFTTSDITVKLEETKGTVSGSNREFKMVPGCDLEKDPKAWVESGSEDCYLFVKLEKSANFDTYMTYTIANGWTPLTGVDGVYYRKVLKSQMGESSKFEVLAGNKVSVKGTVTKADMNSLTATTYPTLTITAYASQLYKSAGIEFTPAQAWANANPTTTTP